MILNQTAVYALRAMAVLARLEPGACMCAVQLAEHTHVPVHYLGKVMRRLVLAELATARKGHGGGFALRRAPAEISFAEILAATGVMTDEDLCAFGWKRCDAESPCPLHLTWSDLRGTVDAWARATNLEAIRTQGSLP